MKKKKFTAVYIRVSSKGQKTRSQIPDLKRWVQSQEDIGVVKVYTDKLTGKTMNRPKWNKLWQRIEQGRIKRLVIWRIDRLGRTASGLTKLFDELRSRKIHFVSVKEGIDLDTPTGRLIANVFASLAEWENELRSERIVAGQAAAKAEGKTWGGSKKGSLYKINMEQVQQIVKMKQAGEKVSVICRTVGVNRQSVYRVLKRVEDGDIKVKAVA